MTTGKETNNSKPSRRGRWLASLSITASILVIAGCLVTLSVFHDKQTEPEGDITNLPGSSSATVTAGSSTTTTMVSGDDYVEPGNPDSGTWKQGEADLTELNNKLAECLNRMTDASDRGTFTKVKTSCFYSIPDKMPMLYAVRHVGEVKPEPKGHSTGNVTIITQWYNNDQAAKDTAHTVSFVADAKAKRFAEIECYWDTFLKQCKISDVTWYQDMRYLLNRQVKEKAEITMGSHNGS